MKCGCLRHASQGFRHAHDRKLASRGRAAGKRQALPEAEERARLWQPVPGGPVFLLTHNFDAVKSYNPANTYTLAVCHLGDRIAGEGAFVQAVPWRGASADPRRSSGDSTAPDGLGLR